MLDGDTGQPGVALGGVLGAFPAEGGAHSGSVGGAAVAQPQAVLPPAPAPALDPVGKSPAAAPPRLWTTAAFSLVEHDGYVIKGLLAPGNVATLLGHPGAHKSTFAAYLAYAVSQGFPVFGMRTRKGRVLYLTAEDVRGVQKRLFVLAEKFGHTPDCTVLECGNLSDEAAHGTVWEAIIAFNPTLVILDTLAAAFAGIDENASKDMGQVVAWLRAVAATGAAVLVLHHPAKAADGGLATPRGHGCLNGTLDANIVLVPDDVLDAETLVRANAPKNRNGSTAWARAFRKEVIVLGKDSEGDNITTTRVIEATNTASPSDFDISTISDVQEIVAGGNYRRDWQAKDWVGNVIGEVLGYKTPIMKGDRKEVEAKIAQMIKDNWLAEIGGLDSARKPRKFVAVGIRAQILAMPTGGTPPVAPLDTLLHPPLHP